MSATFVASFQCQVSVSARYQHELIDPFKPLTTKVKIRVEHFFLVTFCTLNNFQDIYYLICHLDCRKYFSLFSLVENVRSLTRVTVSNDPKSNWVSNLGISKKILLHVNYRCSLIVRAIS